MLELSLGAELPGTQHVDGHRYQVDPMHILGYDTAYCRSYAESGMLL